MIYQGSCHCGGIAFEVEGDFRQGVDCNCSLCRRRGGLLAFVARDKFKLTTPEENLSTYTFNSHGQSAARLAGSPALHHRIARADKAFTIS